MTAAEPETADFLEGGAGCFRLHCWVQPRASRSRIAGRYGDALKIALAAPPVDGKANVELSHFLSRLLKVPKSAVTLVSGQTARRKTVAIQWPGTAEALLGVLMNGHDL